MRRAVMWAAALVVGALAVVSSSASSTTWTHGYDVSWPQCSGTSAYHVPGGAPAYVILGLTHGAGHTANPCLGSQVGWAREHGARIGGYLVPSYPTPAQLGAAAGPGCHRLICRLREDGRRQAVSALHNMRAAGLRIPMIWVDVEFRTPAWPSAPGHNRAVLRGVFAGLRAAGEQYGVYTTSYMWGVITGHWNVDVPNWLPTGDGYPSHAKEMCGTTGTGGRTWLVQYTQEWDNDLTCPVMDPIPAHHGKLWPYRNSTLSLGSSGPAVRAVQGALHMSPSGSYDLTTTLQVTQWQRAHNLPTNGTIDTDDWRALGAFRTWGGRPFRLLEMTTK